MDLAESDLVGLPGRLKAAMDAADMNGVALSEASGVDTGRISRILNGKRLEKLSAVVVLRLSRALGVPLDYLLAGNDAALIRTNVTVISQDSPGAKLLAREIVRELRDQGLSPQLSGNVVGAPHDDDDRDD